MRVTAGWLQSTQFRSHHTFRIVSYHIGWFVEKFCDNFDSQATEFNDVAAWNATYVINTVQSTESFNLGELWIGRV